MIKNLTLIYILVSCYISAKAQNSGENKVDQLLNQYKDGPGAAIGIVKDGELIFSKGYGFSNLDYGIPITSDSKFYIGSMAKQFCGAALLKLETEGKINFNDPITKYLTDFPTYDDVITINHVIHHTSGIRGTSSMQLIAGINQDFEEVFTADQQYEMIKQQKELNFKPGTEFRYSSGGYIVLAKLIERVTGTSFRAYLDEHIFQPLGMTNSFVIDDHQEVVKDRVVSYFPHNNEFRRRSMVFDGMGDGSIMTTINDLLLWDRAFYNDDLLGIPNFAERMYFTEKVESWPGQHYGMALQTEDYKGHLMVAHNGGMLGFRADMVRFPDSKLSVIVLANNAYIHSTGVALEIADMWLDINDPNKAFEEHSYTKISSKEGSMLSGKYFSNDLNSWRRITFENDTLYYDSGNEEYKTPLRKTTKGTYIIDAFDPPAELIFDNDQLQIDYGWVKRNFEKFDDTLPSLEDLRKYFGNYHSVELNTNYKIYEKEGAVLLRVNNNAPVELYPNPTDRRINWNSKDKVWIGYAMIKFQFDTSDHVIGFLIGDNRVKGIEFIKL